MNDEESAVMVSVVMSVYNGRKHLAEAVQSVLDQTYTNFEFIIINDGSQDDSADILRTFKDPRIRLIEQENCGLAAGLNAGIAHAEGRYIARQDADDFWYPQKLEKQVPIMERHPEYDVVACLTEIIDEEGEGPLLLDPPPDPRVDAPFAHTSVLIRKTALINAGAYDERLRYCQDRDLWIRMFRGNNYFVLREVLLRYREARIREINKLLLTPYYGRLVQKLAGVPITEREDIFSSFMKQMLKVEQTIRADLKDGKYDINTYSSDQYHLHWANRYLKAGQAAKAKKHFRSVSLSRIPLREKIKYALAFFPGKPTSVVLKILLIVGRKIGTSRSRLTPQLSVPKGAGIRK